MYAYIIRRLEKPKEVSIGRLHFPSPNKERESIDETESMRF